MSTRSGYGALLGVVAAGSGLAVSELVSGWLHQRVSPIGAVAECIIRLTPGRVIEAVISLVGHHDKTVLIVVTLLGMFALSAGVGVLAMRSLPAALVVLVAMGIVLVLAVQARLTSSQAIYIAPIAGLVTAMVVLTTLTGRARRAAASPPAPAPAAQSMSPDSRQASRRAFLELAGLITIGAVVVGTTGRVLAHGRAALEAARRKLVLPITSRTAPTGTEVGVDGIVPWVTDQDDFYRIDTALAIPQILPDDWRLRLHGRVDNELELTYQDLVDRGLTQAWLTLCCVSNEVGGDLISNAWFSGVLIADLLAEAGVQNGADAVLSTSDDGWTAGTPLAALTDDRHAMLAIAMNGEPLSPEHGFPVRMVVPGLYGYVSATKWVVDMEVTSFSDFSAFWTERGWSAQGPIKTESRIDVPHDGEHVTSGQVAIGGIAWAQHTGIAKVEVRIDDGAWVEAKLGADPSIDTWRQWAYAWGAEPGDHRIQVRATDDSGYTQTGEVAGVVPDGATGWHTIEVSVS
jgi:DMSO/TMAO reductase YedYZ molybdopterin-dependent catalytic subunit